MEVSSKAISHKPRCSGALRGGLANGFSEPCKYWLYGWVEAPEDDGSVIGAADIAGGEIGIGVTTGGSS